jgi:hypothetical protein
MLKLRDFAPRFDCAGFNCTAVVECEVVHLEFSNGTSCIVIRISFYCSFLLTSTSIGPMTWRFYEMLPGALRYFNANWLSSARDEQFEILTSQVQKTPPNSNCPIYTIYGVLDCPISAG